MSSLTMLIRVMQLGAAMALLGSFTFLIVVVRPAFQKGGPGVRPAFERFDHVLLRLAAWSLIGLAGFSLLGLWVQLARVADRPLFEALSPELLGEFLTGTQYGRVWLIRLSLLALLSGFLLLREREGRAADWWALRLEGAGLAASLLAAQAWAGHAAAAEGTAFMLQVGADALHLLAAGVWLGGLPLLAYFLAWGRRADDPATALVAAEATRRFSALGLASVSLLVLTGLGNAWVLVGGVPGLVGTPYGQLLLVKLGLLFPLLGLGALNLLRDKPTLLRSVAGQQYPRSRDILGRLRRNVLAEAALGGCILLLVGALGVTPPARHIDPTWPFSFRMSWVVTKDLPGVRFQVTMGSLAALVGLAALGYAVGGRRYRLPTAGVGLGAIAYGLWIAGRATAIDAYPTTYLRPAVPYQAISIANGLRLYEEHCAFCHGVAGYGDGPAAAVLRPRPADLTAKHTADHTAGDLFWWLTHGIKGRPMPGFGDRLSEEERWDLINFLRTLAAAEQARILGPQLDPNPWLVAPDFTYTARVGEGQTLKDHRVWEIVLLVFFSLPASQSRLSQLNELYPRLRRLGVEVLAVPLGSHLEGSREMGKLLTLLPIVVDGASEAAATYTMFRKSLSPEGTLPEPQTPPHLELLIDRQGYLRARWIPGDSRGWEESEVLISAITWFNQEKPRAPIPDEHVH